MTSQRVEVANLSGDFPDPVAAEHVRYNPSLETLRELARSDETTTEFGSPAYISQKRSRSADKTANLIDTEFTDADWNAMAEALDSVATMELLCIDRRLGRDPETSFVCRLYVPESYARIGLAWAKLLEPTNGEPDFQTLQLPDWDRREDHRCRIRVLPDAGLTFVLGSDYTGEAKKSFLRLFMYRAKQAGGLGLHAGSKQVRVETDDGVDAVGQAFLGLSATGKSTLTGHGCWLDAPEGAEMLQDDVCALLPDGRVTGSEGKGLYIKTNGLHKEEQPALFRAATDESAIFENIAVREDGRVDFDDATLTSNGRAVIQRDYLESAATDIDMDVLDQLFFITRNPLMPPVARLTNEQAAVAFMLGESVQTSAGDPDAAGESIRVVGTNPFIIGPPGEEGNRFYDLIQQNDVETFVINTGHVGPAKADIGVRESVTILVAAACDNIDWYHDDVLDLDLPEDVPGTNVQVFYPPEHYDDYKAQLDELRTERREHLERFETLDPAILDAVY